VTCPDCTKAESHPHWGGYTADCQDCNCRALAHSPDGWRAATGKTNAPLRDAILRLAVTHQVMASVLQKRVWYWIGRINDTKAAQA